MSKGIDVSTWQGNIDFKKVKAAGIDFVIIRAGYAQRKDNWFEANYQKAKAAGLKVGVYWYSYASTVAGGTAEAKYCANVLAGKQLEYPVYFDLEEKSQINKGQSFCSQLVTAFCSEMERQGYFVGFYASLYTAKNYVSAAVRNRYAYWCAQWASKCTYDGMFGLWQYSSSGTVNGISGRVDMDISYIDYPSIIKSGGYNGYKKGSSSTTSSTKTVDQLAQEVLDGKWGNGEDRKNRLTAAGYNYSAVQARVNELCASKNSGSSSSATYYTVKRGDTLSGIASKYGTTVSAIQKLNSSLITNVNYIQTGWKIRVK